MTTPNEHTINATGEDETRSLRLSKEGDAYRIVIWWGKGDKALATLNFSAEEWDKLVNASAELKAQ